MKYWWRVLLGAAFIFLMGAGSTIVFDETCYGVVFGNYGTLGYYDCLPTTEGSHLPAPLGGWVLISAGIGMLYLLLLPFVSELFRWGKHAEVAMTENQPSDTKQTDVTSTRHHRNSDHKWKIAAIAATASLVSVLITLVITGTNRSPATINAVTPDSEASPSGSDWIVWEADGVQYITLDAVQSQGSDALFVDVGCYSDSAMMIWIGWTTDVIHWGTGEQLEASLRVTESDGSTIEMFGSILPSAIAGSEGHTHYFGVRETDDAYRLAETLTTSSELRLEILADVAFWGPDEDSFPRDSEFAVHVSGMVYPGLYSTYLPQLTRCPYQDYFGVA